MEKIDSTNAAEHSYPIYGRQFKSYRWYKPILVFLLFAFFYLILDVALAFLVAHGAGIGMEGLMGNAAGDVFSDSYDDMDLANTWQSVMSLGSVTCMIPALWLASKIVRDRPFSSYTSARGGWSSKAFWRAFVVAFICIGIPIIVDELFVLHHINDFQMKFTIASFLVVTILGPLQCIAEEYVFRGLLLQTFGSWFRLPIIAVILQSVVFTLLHPYNMVGKIEIFISGVVFALAVWIGRGIEVSSAFHICNNMTIFYLQGMNMATISSETTVADLVVSAVCASAYVIAIFIISKKTDWFDKVKRDDLTAWNQKVEEKIARKEAKKAAKAAMKAEKNGPVGEHDGSASGKHFKQ